MFFFNVSLTRARSRALRVFTAPYLSPPHTPTTKPTTTQQTNTQTTKQRTVYVDVPDLGYPNGNQEIPAGGAFELRVEVLSAAAGGGGGS